MPYGALIRPARAGGYGAALVVVLLLGGGCVEGHFGQPTVHAAPTPPEPRYCYRNLGSVTCFSEPVSRDADRLLYYQGPHPTAFRHEHQPAPVSAPPPPPPPVSQAAPVGAVETVPLDHVPVPDKPPAAGGDRPALAPPPRR